MESYTQAQETGHMQMAVGLLSAVAAMAKLSLFEYSFVTVYTCPGWMPWMRGRSLLSPCFSRQNSSMRAADA